MITVKLQIAVSLASLIFQKLFSDAVNSQGRGHIVSTSCTRSNVGTSSPKGNDAHLRAITQSKQKWKHQFFIRLRAASSVVLGRIWPKIKFIQALMYAIITCKYEKDPIKNNREKVATQFSNYNTICCHGNKW